jgi:hypothetical protein
MKNISKLILFCIGLMFFGNIDAQNFDYSVSSDSVAWDELSSQTILNTSNSAWNISYRIPIGFSFNYLGRSFDSLTIETNGYFVFDANRNYSFISFAGFGDRVDSLGDHAVLGYELTGGSGNHILKIQFKNCGQSISALNSLSYQVWFHEANNKIETRVGPNSYRCMVEEQALSADSIGRVQFTTITVSDTVQSMIGLINMNMNSQVRAYLLTGSFLDPSGQQVDENNTELAHMVEIPRSGYRYTFTPSF